MAIKVIVEFQAKPGERSKLKSLLREISSTHGPNAPGFLGSTVYETLDSSDLETLVSGALLTREKPPPKVQTPPKQEEKKGRRILDALDGLPTPEKA